MRETTMRHVVGRLVRDLGVALFMVAAIGSCKVPFGALNNPVDPESDVYMGAPSDLAAVVVSSTRVDLSWVDNAKSETGFKIERKAGAAGTYVEVATIAANVTGFSNTGLTAGVDYYYRVRAFSPDMQTGYSPEVAGSTAAPTAPSGLTLTVASNTQVNLAWTDNAANETSFKIERKTGAGGTYAQIAAVGANVATYSNAGLASGTTYYYRVRASGPIGDSAYCAEAAATTAVPTAPSGASLAVVSSAALTFNWIDASSGESGFRIERKTGAGGTYAEIATVGPNVTSYPDTGLTAGTTYYYRVRAYNALGSSAYCTETSATTTPVAAPSGLGASVVSATRIDLAWTDNSSSETGFKIERKTGSGGTYAQIAVTGANATGYSDTTVIAGSTYYYRARATTSVGDSVYCTEAGIAIVAPTAPSGTSLAVVSSTALTLSWTDNAGNETGFRIERKTGAGGTYAEIATVGTNITSYPDTGLIAGTTYYYRVRAYNVIGSSAYCTETSATTTPVAAPSGLGASVVSATRVDLVWTDNSGNETGFKIERRTGSGGTYAQITTTAANATAYSDTTVSAGSTYYYRVRATTPIGDSAYCTEVAVNFTIPAAPSGLGLTAVSSTRIDLLWTDNAGNETGFKIERKTGSGGTYVQIATPAANATGYSDTSVSAGSTYYYRVRASNGVGDSSYCTEVAISFTTPAAPSALGLTAISSTRIDLSWTDNAGNETGFKIERKTGAGGTYAQITVTGAGATAYSDTTVIPAQTYYYRVRATNVVGDSSYCTEASVTTPVLVSFDAQGGAAPSPATKLVTLGSSYGALATTSRSNFTFAGWWTGASGTGSQVTAATTVAMAADHTLYVKWTGIVTFSGNGSTGGSTAPLTITAGQSANLTPNGFTRTGYTFSKWNTQANGSGTDYANGASYTMNTGNVTLYAQWLAAGSTWTQRTLPSSQYWRSVTYGNGVFVAVASLSNIAATSPDGITWTQRTLPSSVLWLSVTYGNGVFVAVADNSNLAATSPDGITWTQRTLPSSQYWDSVTYGNGVFVAVAYYSNIAATSPDGITWTQRTLPSSQYWYSVTYGNGVFVAVANNNSNIAATSPDGITWTQRTLPSSQYWYSVTYGNGVFVAVTYSHSGSSVAATSPDGITWTQRTLPSSVQWLSVTYGNGVFVAVASSSNVAATSSDGITWTQRTLPIYQQWHSVTYGNGMFVAVAYNSNVAATSP